MSKLRIMILSAALFVTGAVSAASLSLSPTATTAANNDTVFLDLVVGGLGDISTPSLGVFEVVFGYDSAVLTFIDYSLGFALGDPTSEALDLSLGIIAPGLVNVAETSFLTDAELIALQASSFILATLEFDVVGLAPGSSTFVTIDNVPALGDEFGDPLTLDSMNGASINAVPLPASLWLMLAGATTLFQTRIRRSCGP